MVVGFDDGVVMRDHYLVVANNRHDRGAFRQFDVLDRLPDNLGVVFTAVRDCLHRLGGAAPQRVNPDDVAASHVREQRADRDLLRRDRDVDTARFDEVDVRGAIDQRHDLVRAKTLREHRAQDVGLFGVRQRAEYVDVVDVLLEQQFLISGVANEHDGLVELLGDIAGALLAVLDDLDLVGLLQRLREAHANVAATRNDNATHRVFEAPHLAHEHADVLAVGDEEHLVVFLDDRVAVREHRFALAVNRRDTGLRIRDVILERRDALSHEQAVAVSLYTDEADAAIREIEDLCRAGIENELFDKAANQLLGTDAHVDRDRVLREQLVRIHVLGGADTRDLGRRAELRVRDLAGHHVGFVGVRQRDDDVRIGGSGTLEHLGIRGVADDGANIEAILKLAKNVGPTVDDGDLVGLFT